MTLEEKILDIRNQLKLNSLRREVLYNKYIKPVMDERESLRMRLAVLTSPFDVGDTIVSRCGRKGKVVNITFGKYEGDDYKIFIRNIKKDGSEGVERQAQLWDKWERVEIQDK